MAVIKMHVRNDELLEKLLRSLPGKIERRVTRVAVKAGGAVILKDAKRRAPKGPGGKDYKGGNLRRSMTQSRGLRVRKYPRGGRQKYIAVAGPGWPLGAHGHLIESGTVKRETKKGANRGAITPDPFLEPAFKRKSREAQRKVTDRLWQQIQREAARARARAI
jgi:HK97 gp10 family phage protein